MATVLYIWIFCYIRMCLGQDNRHFGRETTRRDLGLYKTPMSAIYSDITCPSGKRMLSYDDVLSPQADLLDAMKELVWINTTASYTPWVTYKGIYYGFDTVQIINVTNVFKNTQFIDCVQLCSNYNCSYIGLQEEKCFFLSSNALKQAHLYEGYKYVQCRKGYIALCAKNNENNTMAVYQKDSYRYEGVGECLTGRLQNKRFVSFSTKSCDLNNVGNLCQQKDTGVYVTGWTNEKNRRLQYCLNHQSLYVDFKTLNDSSSSVNLAEGEYWINNFRESVFARPGRSPQIHCVTGKTDDREIKLNIADCKKLEYALCINNEHFPVWTTHHITTKSTTTTTVFKEFDLTTTTETRNINGSSTLIIIVTTVVMVVLIVMTVIVIVIKFCKQRTFNSIHGPVYATVRKEGIHNANVIDHGEHLEVGHALIEEDNTYDHTDLSMRQNLQQTDASNYDTMDNIQVTGESIYHHTVTFKTSAGITQDDECVYHHAINF